MPETISIYDLNDKLTKKEQCQIIDVREVPEYESARIAGSKLIPLSAFEQNISKINSDSSSYFLCGVGKRAARAAEYLESIGYKNLYVIDGGIKAWIEAGFPVEQG